MSRMTSMVVGRREKEFLDIKNQKKSYSYNRVCMKQICGNRKWIDFIEVWVAELFNKFKSCMTEPRSIWPIVCSFIPEPDSLPRELLSH